MLWVNKTPAVFLFEGLEEKEKEALLKGGKIKNFSSQEYIYRHGEPADYFYIVSQGTIKLFRETPDGYALTTDILIAGNTAGEIEILESVPLYQSSAMAVGAVSMLQFSRHWLKDAAKKSSQFALNLLAYVAQQARQSEIEVEQQATMSAGQLLACFLQRVCVLHEFDPKGFELPYSKSLIASRLGIELETFSRTWARLKDHGIKVNGAQVAFVNPPMLEEYVCDQCSITHDCPTHQAFQSKVSR